VHLWRREKAGYDQLTWRDLRWADEFVRRIRPYVFVRTEDLLLIKRPNRAVKLNRTGAVILKFLLDGGTLRRLSCALRHDGSKLRAVQQFLLAVKLQLEEDPAVLCSPAVVETPFTPPFSRYPVLSELALTYRCNLRCRFCYAGCNRSAPPLPGGGELSAAQFTEVIRRLYRDAKVPSISFTGGEPLLVKELPRHIGTAKHLGMRVNLITNGTLIDGSAARRLQRAGLDSAQVSIEGVSARTHNAIVGGDAYDRALAGLHALQEAGIAVHSNTTINLLNARECTAFPRFARDVLRTERFSMNLMIPTGSARRNASLQLRYRQVGSLLERIKAASEEAGVEFMWYSPVPLCLFNSIAAGLGNRGCSACDGLVSIAPDGALLPCASYWEPLGNILEDGFERLWRRERACFMREKRFAPESCRRCEDFAACDGGCPLYWRVFGREELPVMRDAAAKEEACW